MGDQLAFDLSEGRRRRDEGLALVASHGAPEFSKLAYETIVILAKRQREIHIDDILAWCPARPHHPNAWGAVWMKAIRGGIIRRTGRVRPTADPKKHGHQYPIYESNLHD